MMVELQTQLNTVLAGLGSRVVAIAARYELRPDRVGSWKRHLLDAAPEVFAAGETRKSPRRR